MENRQPASRPWFFQPSLKTGDEAFPGTPGTGEDLCPECEGSGRIKHGLCPVCGDTGPVIEGMGGA